MVVAEHTPERFHRGIEHGLRFGILALVRERLRQIARSTQRAGMLLAEYPPPPIKHLPLDPLCVGVLASVRER